MWFFHPAAMVRDAAQDLRTLSTPPGNRLERLKGIAKGCTAFASTTSGASALTGAMGMATKLSLWTTTRSQGHDKKPKPVHPGEILQEEFMVPLGLSMNRVAMDLRVPVKRIADIVNEKRGITADTALRRALLQEQSNVLGESANALRSGGCRRRDRI